MNFFKKKNNPLSTAHQIIQQNVFGLVNLLKCFWLCTLETKLLMFLLIWQWKLGFEDEDPWAVQGFKNKATDLFYGMD
jgi:hypothetical protein